MTNIIENEALHFEGNLNCDCKVCFPSINWGTLELCADEHNPAATHDSDEEHSEGCLCDECEETFFDPPGFEEVDFDKKSSERPKYLLGDLLRRRNSLRSIRYTPIKRASFSELYRKRDVHFDDEETFDAFEWWDMDMDYNSYFEFGHSIQESLIIDALQQHMDVRRLCAAHRRSSKQFSDLPSKPRYQKRRQARPDYMQTA